MYWQLKNTSSEYWQIIFSNASMKKEKGEPQNLPGELKKSSF